MTKRAGISRQGLGFTRLETGRDRLQRGKKVTGGTALLVFQESVGLSRGAKLRS